MATVVLMVLLRLGLGCHFFYEGVWKINHPEFSAEGFLVNAKGPAAGLFHSMIYDIDGRERLKIEKLVSGKPILDAWKKTRDDSESRYRSRIKKRDEQNLIAGKKLGEEELKRIKEAIEENADGAARPDRLAIGFHRP